MKLNAIDAQKVVADIIVPYFEVEDTITSPFETRATDLFLSMVPARF